MFVRIRGDTTDVSRKVKGVERELDSLGRSAMRLFGILGAGFGMQAFVRNSIEAQNAVAQLNAVIKSTGGAAGFTQPQLSAMAGELQKVSTFSDEAIMGAQGLLLTFTKIRGDTLTGATKAVLDLATAMGGDLKGAAIQVGKALQDPSIGLTALRRSGVSFSQAQTDVIKKLFATGQAAEAQKMILAELSKEFGGSAEAARGTLGGALTALKNAFGDTLEVSQDSSSGIVGALNTITDALPGMRTKFGEFFGGIEMMMVDASIRFQKLLRLMSTEVKFSFGKGFHTVAPAGALTNEQLEQFRAEQYRTILGQNKPKPTTGSGKVNPIIGDLAGETKKAADFAQRYAQYMYEASQWTANISGHTLAGQTFGDALSILGNTGQLSAPAMPEFVMNKVGINDGLTKEQVKAREKLGIIIEDANKNTEILRSAVLTSAQIIGQAVMSALNVGGGGKGSQIGGMIGAGIGGVLGSALGPPGAVITSGIGSVLGSVVGGIAGSLLGGLFDSNKKEVNANTQALRANTQALLLYAPAGFKAESYRYNAADPKRLDQAGREIRWNASRGGANPLLGT